MYISYDYYRIFYYVAKYRSFTQAAVALLNNQPNITRAMKNLEGELGCTLFVRSHRGVSLTPEGEKLYAHIRIAFEHIQAGEAELAREKSLQGGVVSIGVSEVALHCLLLPILRQYHKLYPAVRIRVSNHSTPQALDALKNGMVDLAVVTTPTEVSPLLLEQRIKRYREVAVCGPSLAALAQGEISLQALTAYPLISLGPQTKTYEFYTAFFSAHGLTLSPDIEASTADQILPMVRNDLGIGFVPQEFVEHEEQRQDVHILRLKEEIPERAICLVQRAGQPLSVTAAALARMIEVQRTQSSSV